MNMNKNLLLIFCLLLITTDSKHLNLRTSFNHNQVDDANDGTSSGSQIAGFIIGPLLFILSFILIWSNQKATAIDHRRMRLVKDSLKQVNCLNYHQTTNSNGQLIHITGDTSCQQTITDRQSGLSMQNTIKIKRIVQALQVRLMSQGQNSQYQHMWVSNNEPYPGGGYTNDPNNWFINNEEIQANVVHIGNYILSESLKNKLIYQKQFVPSINHAYNIANRHRKRVRFEPTINNQYMYFPVTQGNIFMPGTLRVKYLYCQTGPTSIISQSSNSTFTPFRIDIIQNGHPDPIQQQGSALCFISKCTQKFFAPINQLDAISQKIQSAEQMLQRQNNKIHCASILIRVISYFFMVVSICVFLNPITTLLGHVPFIGGSLSTTLSTSIFIASVIICIPIFLLVVSICWLVNNPKVGLILLGIALLATGIVLIIIFATNGESNGEDYVQQSMQHHWISLRVF